MPEYWGLVEGESLVDGKPKKKLPTTKEILDPEGTFIAMWNKIFVMSCVFAVLSDPLFLYIPILKDDMKCLGFDARLKKVTLGLRSVTDLFYIVDILLQICSRLTAKTFASSWISITEERFPLKGEKSLKDALAIAKKISLSYIIIDVLAVLPLPQVREILSGVNHFQNIISVSVNMQKGFCPLGILFHYKSYVICSIVAANYHQTKCHSLHATYLISE